VHFSNSRFGRCIRPVTSGVSRRCPSGRIHDNATRKSNEPEPAMRLTTMTDYSLRLLMYVAQHPERLCTIAEVAGAYDISEAHLMKITHQLSLGGWLVTVRGKGGGMRLAVRPSDIGLGAVVRSIESDFFLVNCLSSESTCVMAGRCQLTSIVSGALESFMQHLDGYTVADLLPVAGKGGLRPKPISRPVSFAAIPKGLPLRKGIQS
jgi:Rrf2 family nitric oxide-sensitive transcriptional repressor